MFQTPGVGSLLPSLSDPHAPGNGDFLLRLS
jgi:hypothetical protein